jgi:hypothetical protein
VEPLVLPTGTDKNWMAREVEENKTKDRKSEWQQGEVHKKTEEMDEYDLMV